MQMRTFLFINLTALLLISACEKKTEAKQPPDQQTPSISLSRTQAKGPSGATVDDTWAFLNEKRQAFSGDFNGDGAEDIIYVVNTAAIPAKAVEAAALYEAWPYYGEAASKPIWMSGGPIALVIVETRPGKQQYHIIHDPNPVSILSTQAAEGMFVLPKSDKQNPAWKEIGGRAKGDVLVIPTEAGIDSYLFWEGSRYQSLEVLEEP